VKDAGEALDVALENAEVFGTVIMSAATSSVTAAASVSMSTVPRLFDFSS